MAGSRTQPLKGKIHPNNSAPRLGLQHVATVPARFFQTFIEIWSATYTYNVYEFKEQEIRLLKCPAGDSNLQTFDFD